MLTADNQQPTTNSQQRFSPAAAVLVLLGGVYLVTALFFYRAKRDADREIVQLKQQRETLEQHRDSIAKLADSLHIVLKEKNKDITQLEAKLALAQGSPNRPLNPPAAKNKAQAISFKGVRYYSYRIDPRRTKLSMHTNGKNRPTSINSVKSQLARQGKTVLFACNGGIFEPDYTSSGLHVQDGKQLQALNTRNQAPSGKFLNFYLQPNGVFALTAAGRAYIKTTPNYKKSGIKPHVATQSGPMLVINKKIHPKFRPQSNSKYIRSGVGVLPNGDIIFAISRTPVRFYDIADFFLKQGCTDALYLDGAISEMYIPELGLRNARQAFASVLTVTQ